MRQGSDLENEYLIHDKPIENKKGSSHLASMLWTRQDQDIIQIYNNTKTLAMEKEQYGFSKWTENPRGHNQPKLQNLPLIWFVLPNKP